MPGDRLLNLNLSWSRVLFFSRSTSAYCHIMAPWFTSTRKAQKLLAWVIARTFTSEAVYLLPLTSDRDWFCVLQGMYSSVICPGLVMTNLTYGILPSFFWTLIMPIMWLVSFSISILLWCLHIFIPRRHWILKRSENSDSFSVPEAWTVVLTAEPLTELCGWRI